MIYDLLRYFSDQDLDKLLEDSYRLKEGLYFRLDFEQEPEILQVFKKEQPIGNLANWFKKMDYYSSLVDMNKPIDPKKQIHSNNIFSFFMKSETLKLADLVDHIERYFSIFLKPKKEDEQLFRALQFALDQSKRNLGAQYVHIEKGTGVLIDDYDSLPQMNTAIFFALNNYLQLKDAENRKIKE